MTAVTNLVVLIDGANMNAKVGQLAFVEGYDSRYVFVKWDRRSGTQQADGEYFPESFRPAIQKDIDHYEKQMVKPVVSNEFHAGRLVKAYLGRTGATKMVVLDRAVANQLRRDYMNVRNRPWNNTEEFVGLVNPSTGTVHFRAGSHLKFID